MIDAREWIARLQDQVPDLLEVGGTLELAEHAAKLDFANPSAYVFLMSESASADEMDMAINQQITAEFSVAIVVHNHAGSNLAGDPQLLHIRKQIMTALIGWTPCNGTPVVRGYGQRISGVAANLLIWQDQFMTDYWTRAA
jgi:hypothetical protein